MIQPDIRKSFPLLEASNNKQLAFLDNAASTQKPAAVLKAMDDFQRSSYANVHRGVYRLAEEATAAYESARSAVARFLNAGEASEIIFTKNATECLNLVAQSYAKTLRPGDGVVLTQMEHHANLVPWQQAVSLHKLVLSYLPLNEHGGLDLTHLNDYLTEKVKVVSVSAMSNVLGTAPDLAPIISRAHEVGAVVIVDAAQAAPHFPIDVRAMDCDFLICTAHKIFGPSGIGMLYGKRPLLEKMPPFLFGGHMINEVQWESSTWAELPFKFEAGTPPITEAVGLEAALDFVKGIGWDSLVEHERDLTEYGLQELCKIPRLKVLGPQDAAQRGPVFAFTVNGVHPHDIASVLDQEAIAVRAGHHCAQPLHRLYGIPASTRASLCLYNSRAEIDRLVLAVNKAIKLLG